MLAMLYLQYEECTLCGHLFNTGYWAEEFVYIDSSGEIVHSKIWTCIPVRTSRYVQKIYNASRHYILSQQVVLLYLRTVWPLLV